MSSQFAVSTEGGGDSIVVLGDVSGSMGSGNQMDILKKSFKSIASKCLTQKKRFVLGSWNTQTEWCCNGWSNELNGSIESWILLDKLEEGMLWLKPSTKPSRDFKVYQTCTSCAMEIFRLLQSPRQLQPFLQNGVISERNIRLFDSISLLSDLQQMSRICKTWQSLEEELSLKTCKNSR